MQRILQISILPALILASLCRVHANIHPLAFALWVALITQCELRTCATPPAEGICVPQPNRGVCVGQGGWEAAHSWGCVPAEPRARCSLLEPIGWEQGERSSEIPFCSSVKWRNGSALHVVHFDCGRTPSPICQGRDLT